MGGGCVVGECGEPFCFGRGGAAPGVIERTGAAQRAGPVAVLAVMVESGAQHRDEPAGLVGGRAGRPRDPSGSRAQFPRAGGHIIGRGDGEFRQPARARDLAVVRVTGRAPRRGSGRGGPGIAAQAEGGQQFPPLAPHGLEPVVAVLACVPQSLVVSSSSILGVSTPCRLRQPSRQTATREICANPYKEITNLRRGWHDDALEGGMIEVVYTGDSSDEGEVFKHVRRLSQNKVIQRRMKNPNDPLELVIVQSMLLTGFDAPPLHTMYLDKPMRGAALMQAIARVNRTYLNKPDGLLVGYAPVADRLREALAEYTSTDQAQQPLDRDIEEMLGKVRTLHDVILGILAGYDWRAVLASGAKTAYKYAVLGTRPSARPNPGSEHGRGRASTPARCSVPRRRVPPGAGVRAVRGQRSDRRPACRHRILPGGPGLHGEARR